MNHRTLNHDQFAELDAHNSEGPQVGYEKQFVMVDDDFLPYMRTKGFPFRVG
jgi:hypothetical protein